MAIYAASLLGEIALTWVGFQGEPTPACLAPTLHESPCLTQCCQRLAELAPCTIAPGGGQPVVVFIELS